MVTLYKSKAWLTHRYIAERKSAQDIAEECGTSLQVIQYWLTKYKLIRNQRSWSRK